MRVARPNGMYLGTWHHTSLEIPIFLGLQPMGIAQLYCTYSEKSSGYRSLIQSRATCIVLNVLPSKPSHTLAYISACRSAP